MKKLIVYLLTIIQLGFSFSYVLAADSGTPTLPTPPNGWSEQYDSATKKMLLVFSMPGNTPMVFSQIVSGAYEGAVSTASLPVAGVWSLKQSGASTVHYSVITVSPQQTGVTKLCVTPTVGSLPNIKILSGAQSDAGLVVFQCSEIRGTADMAQVNDNDPARKAQVQTILTNGLGSSGLVKPYTRNSGAAPLEANVTACAANKITKIYSDPAKITALFAQIKQQVDTNPENAGNTTMLDEFVERMMIDTDLKNQLQATDSDMYSQFYSTNAGLSYPNVMLDNNKKNDLITIVDSVEFNRVIDNSTVKPIAGKSGFWAILGGTTWNVVSYPGRWMINSITKTWTYEDFKRTFMAFTKLTIALTYIKANEAFNQCLADKGDPYAYINPDFVQYADSLQRAESDIASGMEKSDDQCTTGDQGYIANMIASAFCGMTLILNSWANTFYCWSLGLLESSLGVTDQGTTAATINKETVCATAAKSESSRTSSATGTATNGTAAGTTPTAATPTGTTGDTTSTAATGSGSSTASAYVLRAKVKFVNSEKYAGLKVAAQTQPSSIWAKIGPTDPNGKWIANNSEITAAKIKFEGWDDANLTMTATFTASKLIPQVYSYQAVLAGTGASNYLIYAVVNFNMVNSGKYENITSNAI